MSGQYKIMYSSMDQFYDQTNGRMAEWVSQNRGLRRVKILEIWNVIKEKARSLLKRI